MIKTFNTRLLLPLFASIVAITPLAIDMYLPAMLIMSQDFNTSISNIQISLSVYLAGYALGMLFFGPLADQFGRKKLAILGLSGFLVSSLILAFTRQIEVFFIFRAIQAFTGAAATVVVPGVIRYIYQKDTAKGMSYVSMIMMLAPLIAPTIGASLISYWHWSSIFFVLSAYSLIILLLVAKYFIEIPIFKSDKTGLGLFLDNYGAVFSNKKARLDIATSVLASFAFFCFLTSAPFIYLDYFEVPQSRFGFLFAFNVIALMLGNFLNTRLVPKVGSRKMLHYGLLLALISSSLLFTTSLYDSGLYYTIAALAPLMMSLGVMASNSDSLVLLRFEEKSGTATAVIGTLRFGVGALAGPLLALFWVKNTLPFSTLMLSAVILIILCQWKIKLNLSKEKLKKV
ncbi:multidrug effflux MFS transporter [Pseudoalteromonas denitrificans]|uniref:Bcr/CflA family efflux transporter n=1 Tax=Pseudoalteromonas denitrificans DSM 6059 TaxID=1123010 RepID=A0A1I1NA11_9GAMM|nr:multidrug effflux MFS transporter [Pseudoalteromonas denitrificans]SFC94072.1 MFS transporter, DHA1 family, bicyclomycin/chloramphenicol resistance protein [Pseudoalteromonas denitrificans DSM 6059]